MPSDAQNFNTKQVLVAPLDWGLGHATRCIPLINSLQTLGYSVVLAGEGAQSALLQESFPELTIIPLRGYRIRYTRKKWLLPFSLLFQLPGILASIRRERRWLRGVMLKYHIDLVISDNRYGLYNVGVSSVIITHQLCIQTPALLLQKAIQRWHYRLINRFTACWVPDAPGSINLGGVLSHPAEMPVVPVHYIGLLSRLSPATIPKQFDFLVLLSGPEPQRSVLENAVKQLFKNRSAKVCWVRGLPGSSDKKNNFSNGEVYNHLSPHELAGKIAASRFIICRSGYSSMMDLARMQANVLLIPTPGQTEQEYLAEKLSSESICIQMQQNRIALPGNEVLNNLPTSPWPAYLFFSTEILSGCLQSLSLQTPGE
jgi:hypothetical protein